MKQRSFEDLLVWQKSQALIEKTIGEMRKWRWNKLTEELTKQLYRSVQSIGANIAEGYGRGSSKDFQRFLIISRGSLSETGHWLHQAYKERHITLEKLDEFKSMMNEINKMLASFISKLRSQ
ncbi:hypothetical protein A2160_04470 [Candidatus Beckwithbacteria bacterium RBG_13_42_9]|uniref:Four helix bundle protein n=1 Tax=Candidatus Beckwithbacteria bacterium RBG_13_42_9 TaxID=1797457 RepID=A0A1F5E8I3_9BACT|nr:MAG: hypothetical protein A2160_04470 [Candidatus Beckwithbacteria bacterium RBG_13_42_9]